MVAVRFWRERLARYWRSQSPAEGTGCQSAAAHQKTSVWAPPYILNLLSSGGASRSSEREGHDEREVGGERDGPPRELPHGGDEAAAHHAEEA